MKGKTIVATGATSGIGEAAVLALAGMGARIVIVARDEARAKATMQKLEAKAPGLGHRLHLADLSSMAETRKVGAAIAASEPRIDVLINNAGALFSNRRVTPEGLELTFALNHMAYFVLTEALRDKLVASAPARIVSTSSAAHQGAKPRLQRPCRAPRLQRLQGLRPLEARQYPVHPRTRPALGRNGRDRQLPPSRRRRDPVRRIERRLRRPSDRRSQTVLHLRPKQGADTIVYLASSPEVANTTGGYFVKRKLTEPSAAARDDAAAKRLWEASEKLAS